MNLSCLDEKTYAICGGSFHIFIGLRWTAGVQDFNVLIGWNALSSVLDLGHGYIDLCGIVLYQ